MTEWSWLSNSDFSKLITIDEGSEDKESEKAVPEGKDSQGATRVSLEPTLKCGACNSRIFVIDYCSKTFADKPMASNEVASFVREKLQDLSCSQCGERRVQLVWIGKSH